MSARNSRHPGLLRHGAAAACGRHPASRKRPKTLGPLPDMSAPTAPCRTSRRLMDAELRVQTPA
ncbi:MAG: hypothetical protein MZV70_20450 [Desulfobacterales bacterium]|nr:hypothetical protein [Desulfobacterales bacterium]